MNVQRNLKELEGAIVAQKTRELDERWRQRRIREQEEREKEVEEDLEWLEGQFKQMAVAAEQIQPRAPSDTGEAGARKRYPDTGQEGIRKRKYPDTGG